MKKTSLLILVPILFLFTNPLYAQWQVVGQQGLSAGTAPYESVAIAPDGTPYIAYEDYANGKKATIRKFNGTIWDTVGTVGISPNTAVYLSLAIDKNGTPYLAYEDQGNSGTVTVRKFNGAIWDTVGSIGFSGGVAQFVSLAIDASGTPYVAYKDGSDGSRCTVRKFNGSSWVLVGSSGFSAGVTGYESLALDKNGNPYVAYVDAGNGNKTTVMKFNGDSWVTIGTAGFSAGTSEFQSLAIDTDGNPIVAFEDFVNSGGVTVMKFNGTNWNALGSAGFTGNYSPYTSLVLINGTPYVAYEDETNDFGATVTKFDGSTWNTVGVVDLSGGEADYESLAAGKNGKLYIGYRDFSDLGGGKATVMDFTVGCAAPSITGQPSNDTTCAGTNARFIVGATGTGLTYQWQVDAGSGFTNVTNNSTYAGATNDTLVISNVSSGMNGYSYQCVVSNSCDSSVTSDSATLNVRTAPAVVANASATTVCSGTAIILYGTGAKTYTWDNGVTDSVGFSATSTTTYHVTGTDANGCTANDSITVTVNQPTSGTTDSSICQGDSVLFNGTYYKATGSYPVSLTNSVNCDSTATLVLTVNQPTSSSTPATICQGDSVLFNGTYYKSAGSFPVNLTNVAGCDSTATLVVTVNQPSSSTTDTAICQGDSVLFNGTYYKTSGSFPVNLTNSVNCDSTATLVLTVNQPTSSNTPASICQGDSVLFNGTYYKSGGSFSVNFTNSAGCDSTATLTLTVNQPTFSTTNDTICSTDSVLFNGTFYKTAGSYPVVLTNSVNCDSTATLVLTLKQASFSDTSATICQGDSVLFKGTFYSVAGNYPVVTSANSVGCDSIVTLSLTVNQPSFSTFDTAICMGDSVAFNEVYYKTTGSFSITTINSVGCDSTATLVLTVSVPDSGTFTTSICAGDSILFNGTYYKAAGTYSAHLPNIGGCDSTAFLVLSLGHPDSSTTNTAVCQGDSTLFNGTFYSVAGTYPVLLTNTGGCDSTAFLVLTVNQPSFGDTTQSTICQGDSVLYQGTYYNATGFYAVVLTNNAGCDSTVALNLTVNQPTSSTNFVSICQGDSTLFNGTYYNSPGNYSVHLTNSVNCDSTSTLVLTVNQPSSSITDTAICQGDSVQFNGTFYSASGSYPVVLTNSVNCDSTATLVLTVNQPSSSSTPATICQGDSVLFNGTYYKTGGSFPVVLTNSVGCDSTATLVLTVNQPSASTNFVSICQGDSTLFNGTYYSTGGSYSVNLTNSVNCDSTATLVLTVNQPSSSSTPVTICNGDSVLFNGTYYKSAGSYPVILTNSVNCDSTATLVLTVNQPSSSTTDSSICQGDSVLFNGIYYKTSGSFPVSLTNSVNCDSTATLVLTVNQPTSSTTVSHICIGDSVLFNGTYYKTTGNFPVTGFTNSAGCDSTATLALNVSVPDSSTNPVSICQGDSVLFNGTFYNTAGTYQFTLPNIGGCDSTAFLMLTVNQPSFSTTNDTICSNDSVLFNGTYYKTAGSYPVVLTNSVRCDSTATLVLTVKQATGSEGSTSICQGDSVLFEGTYYKTAGTYTVILTNSVGCDSITILNLTVNQPSSSTTDSSICQGDSVLFNGTYYKTSGSFQIILVNSGNCDSTATLVLTVNQPSSSSNPAAICQGDSILFNGTYYKTAGSFPVVLTNSVGCDSTATLVLTVNQPSFSTTNDTICSNDSVLFNGTYYKTAGSFPVILTNSANCDSTATLVLTVKQASFSDSTSVICQGDSVLFQGTYYKTSGSFPVVLTNSVGCDSTITLNLTVNQPSFSTTNSFICMGDSVLFNGTYFKINGSYPVTGFTNSLGCDSTATLVLSVSVPDSSINPMSICNGDSLLFNGTYYKTAGTFRSSLHNIGGCDSVAVLVLTVNQPSSSTTKNTICNGDSVLFNGTYYKTAGSFPVTLTNSVDCDSTATLVLTVNQPSSSSMDTAICMGDSVLFNSTYYKTGGSFSVTLTNSVNCDSTATLVLTVNQPTSSTLDKSICQGDSVLFNGNYFKTTGTFSVTTTNSAGCDSTATLMLTVNQPTSSTLDTSICQGDSVMFNGIYYKTSGSFPVSLTNSNNCDSTATLVLTVNQPTSSTTNVSICQGDSTFFNGAYFKVAGSYPVTTSNIAGCDSTSTLVLTVNQPSSSTTNTTICNGDSVLFNGTYYKTAGSFNASLTNSVNCDSTATLVLTVNQPSSSTTKNTICNGDSVLFNGTYYKTAGSFPVILTNSVNCDSTATLVLTVNQPTSSTTKTSICNGDSVLFNGTYYKTAGSFPVTLTNSVNCDSTATLVLTVNQPSSSTTNSTICLGDSVLFNGTYYKAQGSYPVVLTNSVNCDSTATLVLTVISSPVVPSVSITANPGTTICSGVSVTFTATPTNGGTPTYQWKLNGQDVGANSDTYTNSSLANGDTVSVLMTSGLSCAAPMSANSNVLTMTVNAPVTASVTISPNPASPICAGTPVTFTATPTGGGATPSYQWKLNGVDAGINSNTYSNSSLNNGDSVSVLLTSNATCVVKANVNSNVVTMTVNPVVTPSVTIFGAPATTICSGTTVTFHPNVVVGGGSSPSYQWKLNGSNVGTNSTSYPNSNLQNGDKVWVVMTSNAACTTTSTANSDTITITVNTTPNAPVATAGTNATLNQITAHWNASAGATTYFIDVSTSNVFATFVTNYNNKNTGNVTSLVVGGLTSGTTYYYRVRANNSCGTSTSSDTIAYATATATNCNGVIGGTVSPASSVVCSSVTQTLTLTGQAGGTIQWQSSSDNVNWTDINGATDSIYITPFITARTYFRSVTISNICFNIASTTAIVDVSVTPVVTITQVTSTSATVNWTPFAPGQYNISWSGAGTGSASAVAGNGYVITGLAANQTLNVTVTQATPTCGGTNSGTASVQTLCATPDVISVVAAAAPAHAFTVTWASVNGASAYRVYYLNLSTNKGWSFVDTTGTSKTITGTAGGQTFAVYVAVKNCPSVGQFGEGSTTYYVTTNPASGCSPTPVVSATSNCPNQVTVDISGGSGPYLLTMRRISPSITSEATTSVSSNIVNVSIGIQNEGTVWEVFARTNCGGGSTSDISNVAIVTIKPSCPSVTNLVVSQLTCNGFTASWNENDCLGLGVTSYDLLIKKSSTLNYNAYPEGITDHAAVNFLTSGVTYDVEVLEFACNGAPSALSTVQVATLPACREDDETVSANSNAPAENEAVLVYPNPAQYQFSIDIGRKDLTEAPVKIELINELGQVVETNLATISQGHLTSIMNVGSTISSGIYFVRTSVGSNVHVNSIMITKQ